MGLGVLLDTTVLPMITYLCSSSWCCTTIIIKENGVGTWHGR